MSTHHPNLTANDVAGGIRLIAGLFAAAIKRKLIRNKNLEGSAQSEAKYLLKDLRNEKAQTE